MATPEGVEPVRRLGLKINQLLILRPLKTSETRDTRFFGTRHFRKKIRFRFLFTPMYTLREPELRPGGDP
jgi:hypothetical protein